MGVYVPVGVGWSEVVEKRSRFLGCVLPIDCEGAAKEEIARIKSERHDARHNCWCFIVLGGPERYSDDGEPQGTAGLPMLEVLRRNGIVNACCVVTRYFGGILLGAGGLLRAYTEAAKLALDDAGPVELRLWECMEITCPYNLLGRINLDIESLGGVIEGVEYGGQVTMRILVSEGQANALSKRLADVSSGGVLCVATGKKWSAAH